MIKKILKVLLIVLIFTYKINVNASTITWENITDIWKTLADENIIITANESSLIIENHLSEEEIYKVEYKYEEGIISLIKANTSDMTEEQKYKYDNLEEIYTSSYMIGIICDLYNIDFDYEILNEETYSNYGINLQKQSYDYAYTENEVEVELTIDEVIEFTLNLDEFEEKTKSLQGSEDENEDDYIFDEPTISLSLEKANPTSLDLIVEIDSYSKEGICEIIMIPSEGTGFPTGTSKTVATINNCKVGKNKVTVQNLQSNTEYLFQVLLDGGIVGNEYKKFKTTAQSTSTTGVLNNPKTGDNNIALVIIFLVSSAISFILIYNKQLKNF